MRFGGGRSVLPLPCKPRADSALLGDREADILQRQGDRRDGGKQSLTASRRTYVPNFQTWAAFPSNQSALYAGFSPRHLVGRVNCPTGCWTNSMGAQRPPARPRGRTPKRGSGTFTPRLITDGAETSALVLQIESDFYSAGRGKPSRTFRRHFRNHSLTSRTSSSKDPYNFDFLTLTTEAQERRS